MLLQEGWPLAFFSQALPPPAHLKLVYERELMAVVCAIKKWRHYLMGRHFTVCTDQRSLKFLLNERIVSIDQQKWLCKLLGYDFDIEYNPVHAYKAVDALSRLPSQSNLLSLSVPQVLQLQEVEKQVAMDPSLSKIKTALAQGQPSMPGYSLKQGRLYYRNKLVLLEKSDPIPLLLQEYHNSPNWRTFRSS